MSERIRGSYDDAIYKSTFTLYTYFTLLTPSLVKQLWSAFLFLFLLTANILYYFTVLFSNLALQGCRCVLLKSVVAAEADLDPKGEGGGFKV